MNCFDIFTGITETVLYMIFFKFPQISFVYKKNSVFSILVVRKIYSENEMEKTLIVTISSFLNSPYLSLHLSKNFKNKITLQSYCRM